MKQAKCPFTHAVSSRFRPKVHSAAVYVCKPVHDNCCWSHLHSSTVFKGPGFYNSVVEHHYPAPKYLSYTIDCSTTSLSPSLVAIWSLGLILTYSPTLCSPSHFSHQAIITDMDLTDSSLSPTSPYRYDRRRTLLSLSCPRSILGVRTHFDARHPIESLSTRTA